MITPGHARLMARYNRWQNASLYGAAATLGDDDRRLNRGAFFGSIHGTLNHLFWGDSIWLHRFAGTPKPSGSIADSPGMVAVWDDLVAQRKALDAAIINWAEILAQAWLEGETTWTASSTGRVSTQPNWMLVTHFFNHQTHHRGQVHAMLTAAGARPEATDVIFMPDQL